VKLATFSGHGEARIGVVVDDRILDLSEDPDMPTEMVAFLESGDAAMEAARRAAEGDRGWLALSEVRLEAPVRRPPKLLAIGLNYADHIAEVDRAAPEFPRFFNKQSTCVVGPFDAIHLPAESNELDYEGELGIVIGQRCRRVDRSEAHSVIAGYVVANDVSARDWQVKSSTVTLGKSFDTHGPLGPWIVTPDEVGNPHELDLTTWVNGEIRQSSNTRHLIHDCFEMIEVLSTVFTLEAGDVILTGTPSGVGFGFVPPRFLAAGDTIRVEIDRVGMIENSVIEEPPDQPPSKVRPTHVQ
jgi:2-keto-4-pentenoate hydratase/2-oxohepta-3-ene-1,7-dioic acid hydratase in catechol pathway